MNIIPDVAVNVSVCPFTSPNTVAASGSIQAIIAAFPGSVLFKPIVYSINGRNAVTMPVSSTLATRVKMLGTSITFAAMPGISQTIRAPALAKIKAKALTVYGWYFLKATVPKILYNAYEKPESKPNTIPDIFIPFPRLIPDMRTHPEKAIISAIIFCIVNFSLKKTADITETIMGEVYKSIAAIE